MKSGFLSKGLAFAVAIPLLATIAACGSAANSASAGNTGGTTIPVGIVEDLSGPDSGIAASSKLAVQQVKQADFEARIQEIGVAWKS
jgi:hypothetical protein